MALLLKLFSSRVPAYLLVALLLGGAYFSMHQRIRALTAERDLAQANAAIAQDAAVRSLAALKELEAASAQRKSEAAAAVEIVERVRTETVEKIVYIEREPTPATCPDAIDYLVNLGNQLDGVQP